jgi:hypothetical protein
MAKPNDFEGKKQGPMIGTWKFLLGVIVAVLTIYTTEIAKQAIAARTVAAQLDAQLRVFGEKFDEFPALGEAADLGRQWHDARSDALRRAAPGSRSKAARSVDEDFHRKLDDLASRATHGFFEGTGIAKQTPILLDALISGFEEDKLDLRTYVTLIADSEAAKLGPEVAYQVVGFRQHNRDSYSAVTLFLKYRREGETELPAEAAPYLQLYLRNRVKAYRDYFALREMVDPMREMNLLDFSLLQFSGK